MMFLKNGQIQAAREMNPRGCWILLSNESETFLLGLSNELAPSSDGWVLISPYGDFRKEKETRQPDGSMRYQPYIQRVNKPAAERMVREFETVMGSKALGTIKRFVSGKPIYSGHPDDNPVKYTDHTRYGMFAALRAGDDGFYGRPVLSEDAEPVLANEGKKWLSPFWAVELTGETEGGVPVCMPVKLISAGLTASPNIRGGQPLANEEERKTMEFLKRLAVLLALANTAGEAEVETAVKDLKAKADGVPALENEAGTAKSRVTTLENEFTAMKTRAEAAEAAAKSERTARVELIANTAIETGRISLAEKPAAVTALSNESSFSTEASRLATLPPKYKTQSQTGDLGQRQQVIANEQDRHNKRLEIANENYGNGTKGVTWDDAWAKAKRDHKELFEDPPKQ